MLLSYLLKKFIGFIQEIDGNVVKYEAKRLKKRIELRYPQEIFHLSKTMVKGTLVYSNDLLEANKDDSQEEDGLHEEENSLGERSNPNVHDCYRRARVLMAGHLNQLI